MTLKITNYDDVSKDFNNYKIFDDNNVTTERLGYEKLLSLIENNKGRKLLDYWAGSWAMTKQMSKYFDYTLWIDVSHELVKIAQQENMWDNIEYWTILDGNNLSLYTKNKLFDVITINYVLCTIPYKGDIFNILSQLYNFTSYKWKIYIHNANWDESNGIDFKTYKLNKKEDISSGDLIITTLSSNSNSPFDVNDYFYSQQEYKDLLERVWYQNVKIHIIYWDKERWRIDESKYSPCYIIEGEKI